MDSPGVVNWVASRVGVAGRLLALLWGASLVGCGWTGQGEVEREAASVGSRLATVEAVTPERPGFRSLTRSRHPYLGLKEVEAVHSRLPEALLSEVGTVVTLGDLPDDEILARRIADAAGISVRVAGAAWQPTDESAPGGETVRDRAQNGWLLSWADELAGEGGVWAGSLDRLLDGWTKAAGYRWEYDAGSGTVDVVRSETVVFDVYALQGNQTYTVTTTTQGTGGEATSGSSSQSISSNMSYDPWTEIDQRAQAAAGSEGAVSVSRTSGTVSVSGLPRAVERVRQYLEHVNRHVLRPVTLSVHLYSVRFDKGSGYEVGLTGILPEAFGSDFVVGVDGGSISVVRPTSVGASTLRATVNALRKIGTASRVLSVDVPTLNGRPAQFYDLFDEAYLQQVSTTIEDGVRAVELTPGMVSSGFGLSFVAQIVGPDQVLARITATIQDRPEFAVFGAVGNQIQLPAGGRRAIVVTQRIARGETLLLTGFRDRSSSGSREGTFHPAVPLPEGAADTDIARVETALLVTARIGEPLGIFERRVGLGAGGFVQGTSGNTAVAGAGDGRAVSEVGAGAVGEAGG